MPHPLIGFGLSRAVSIQHHLQSNHYPPVDVRWVPHCEKAIDRAVEEYDEFTGQIDSAVFSEDAGQGKTVGDLLEGLHLWDFVEHGIALAYGEATEDELDDYIDNGDEYHDEPKRGE